MYLNVQIYLHDILTQLNEHLNVPKVRHIQVRNKMVKQLHLNILF